MTRAITVHEVKKGESLARIAKKYGIPSWKTIYDDPANAKLRKERKNPDKIMPGDKVVVKLPGFSPASRKSLDGLIAMLDARIKKLDALRADNKATAAALTGEIRTAAAKAKRTGDAADLAASIILFLKDLSKLAVKGGKAMQAAADELDAANKAFMKEFRGFYVNSKKDLIVSPAYQKARDSGSLRSERKVLEGTMIVYDSWLKMGAPSFWARTYVKLDEGGFLKKLASGAFSDAWDAWSRAVTWDPQAELKKGVQQIRAQEKKIDDRLRKSIEEDKALLQQLKTLKAAG